MTQVAFIPIRTCHWELVVRLISTLTCVLVQTLVYGGRVDVVSPIPAVDNQLVATLTHHIVHAIWTLSRVKLQRVCGWCTHDALIVALSLTHGTITECDIEHTSDVLIQLDALYLTDFVMVKHIGLEHIISISLTRYAIKLHTFECGLTVHKPLCNVAKCAVFTAGL